jgi:2,3-dihydro-2,3-dihydroxybenzoate dehydrogenase
MTSPLPNLSEFHLHPGIALVTGAARGIGAVATAAQYTRCLGLELAESGIRCIPVSPGSTDTGMQCRFWRDGVDSAEFVRSGPHYRCI